MLTGVRVADLSRLLPGPFATQILADLGAEVIKVEDPHTGGDYARYYPPLAPDNNSVTFHAINRGKKSIALNLKLKEHKDIFWKFLQTCDVLLETFRPGVMEKLGLGIEIIRERLPGLIICSISGYGQDGPDRLRAGHDLNYLSKAGIIGMMGKPTVLPVQVADIAAGSYPAVIQILAALFKRKTTGEGCYIDVSMADCAIALTAFPFAQYSASGQGYATGKFFLNGCIPCYKLYETQDGHISVGALEPKFWKGLLKAIGLPTNLNAFDNSGKVSSELQAIFKQKSNAEWRRFFAPLDVMCEVVEAPENILTKDEHFKSRDLSLNVQIKDNTFEDVQCGVLEPTRS